MKYLTLLLSLLMIGCGGSDRVPQSVTESQALIGAYVGFTESDFEGKILYVVYPKQKVPMDEWPSGVIGWAFGTYYEKDVISVWYYGGGESGMYLWKLVAGKLYINPCLYAFVSENAEERSFLVDQENLNTGLVYRVKMFYDQQTGYAQAAEQYPNIPIAAEGGL